MYTSDKTSSVNTAAEAIVKKQQKQGNSREPQKNKSNSKKRAKSDMGPGLDEPDDSAKEAMSEKKPYKRAKISEHAETLIRSNSEDDKTVSDAES